MTPIFVPNEEEELVAAVAVEARENTATTRDGKRW
jgi:hypothetical protein